MSNVVIFKQSGEPEYKESVDTRDYVTQLPPTKSLAQQYALPDVIINPDLSAVANVPRKFWKRSGNLVVEMTAAEKQIVIDAENAAKLALEDRFDHIDVAMLARALVRLNITTKAKLKQAIQEVRNG